MKIRKSLNNVFVLSLITIILFSLLMLVVITSPIDSQRIEGYEYGVKLFNVKYSYLVVIAFVLLIPSFIITVASKKQRNLRTKTVFFINSGLITIISGLVIGWTIYYLSLIYAIFEMDFAGILSVLFFIVISILLTITTALYFLLALSVPSQVKYNQDSYDNNENSQRDNAPRPQQFCANNSKLVVEQLKDLKMLFDEGIITESEYESKRKKVIEEL